ncbi:MAG: ribonuclease P protein component [Pseudomonadota bacterium]
MDGSLTILKKRQDFLACNKGRRQVTAGFVLLGRPRRDGSDAIRVGFTCSKKLGNAVARNRAKRRLREVARLGLPNNGQAGWDYVLIGRPEATVSRDFASMQTDLSRALNVLHP